VEDGGGGPAAPPALGARRVHRPAHGHHRRPHAGAGRGGARRAGCRRPVTTGGPGEVRGPAPRWLIRARWLFDGTGQPPAERGAVLVEDGRIARVWTYGAPEAHSGAETVDLPEATLLPGLVDAHVHLCLPGDGTPLPEATSWPRGVVQAVALRNAARALA